MTYRDDRDARLAQAEALRRENEELREANARLERERDAPRPAPAPERPRGPLLGPQFWKAARTAGIAAVVVVGIVMVVGGLVHACKRVTAPPPPSLREVMLIPEEGAVAVHLTRTRSGKGSSRTTHEIASFDLATGEPRGTVELHEHERGSYTLFPRAGHRAWGLRPDGKLELVDLAAPAKLVAGDGLADALPALAGGYRVLHGTVTDYDAPYHAMRLELPDGSTRYVDMTPALHESPPPGEPWRPGYFCGPDWGAKPSCERRQCIVFAPVEGTTALVRGIAPTWDEGSWGTATDVSGPEATRLLRPGLVELLETECAFELDGAVLVLHDSSAMDPKETLLSLVEADGRARWTLPLAELTDRRGASALGAITHAGAIHLFLAEDKRTLDHVRIAPDGAVLERRRLF